jgi:hypothetical protein
VPEQISILELKTMWRPSGAHSGLLLSYVAPVVLRVRGVRLLPSIFMIQMLLEPVVVVVTPSRVPLLWKTTLVPSGEIEACCATALAVHSVRGVGVSLEAF